MALPQFHEVLADPAFSNAPVERQKQINEAYWKAYDAENPNDEWGKAQRADADLALTSKEKLDTSSPIARRGLELQREAANNRLRIRNGDRMGVFKTPEERQSAVDQANAEITQKQERLKKTFSLFDPEVDKAMQPAWQALETSARTAGIFGSPTISGDTTKSRANYESYRNNLASEFGLDPTEVDDLVKHRLGLQDKSVSRDAAGVVHVKDEILNQGADAVVKSIEASDLPTKVKEDLVLEAPERVTRYKDGVINMIKKQHPELASDIAWTGDIEKDYAQISNNLNKGAWSQFGSGFEAYTAESAGRFAFAGDPSGMTAPGARTGQALDPASMAEASQRDIKRSQSINELSHQLNQKKVELFGTDAAIIGSGVASAVESVALGAATGGLGDALITADRIKKAGTFGKMALGFAQRSANVAPVAGYFGANQAISTYEQAIAANKSPAEAAKLAAISGTIEAGVTTLFSGIKLGGTEDIGQRLTSSAAREGFTKSLGNAALSFGKDVLGENFEETTIQALDTIAVQAKLNPQMTVDELKKSLRDTVIATTLTTAPLGAVTAASEYRDARKPTYDQSTESLHLEADAKYQVAAKENVPPGAAQARTFPTSGVVSVAQLEQERQAQLALTEDPEEKAALEEAAPEDLAKAWGVELKWMTRSGIEKGASKRLFELRIKKEGKAPVEGEVQRFQDLPQKLSESEQAELDFLEGNPESEAVAKFYGFDVKPAKTVTKAPETVTKAEIPAETVTPSPPITPTPTPNGQKESEGRQGQAQQGQVLTTEAPPAEAGGAVATKAEAEDQVIAETDQSILERTEPGKARDEAFGARRRAAVAKVDALKKDDVVIDENGDELIVENVLPGGKVFFKGYGDPMDVAAGLVPAGRNADGTPANIVQFTIKPTTPQTNAPEVQEANRPAPQQGVTPVETPAGEAQAGTAQREGEGEEVSVTKRKFDEFKKFFSDVTKGTFGKSDKPFVPELPLTEDKQQKIIEVKQKHSGNFDDHIMKSIPTFYESQIGTIQALSESLPQGAVVLDIAASEGSWGKALTEVSGNTIETVSLDPNEDMANFFSSKSTVPGATYSTEAFKEGFDNIPAHKPSKKYDAIHESMGFQFISPDREGQIAEVKNLLAPNGIFTTEQKVKNPNWTENEKFKDQNHKNKYFTDEELKAKDAKVGFAQNKDETKAVGMVANQVEQTELEQVLKNNFKHVAQYWDSGNFKGYVASDSKEAIDKFLAAMPDLTSKFSSGPSKKMLTEAPVAEQMPADVPTKAPAFSEVAKLLEQDPSPENIARVALAAAGIFPTETTPAAPAKLVQGELFQNPEAPGDPNAVNYVKSFKGSPPKGATRTLIDYAGDELLSGGDLGDLPSSTVKDIQEANQLIQQATGKKGRVRVGRIGFNEFLSKLWRRHHRGKKPGWHNFQSRRDVREMGKILSFEVAHALSKDGSGVDWYNAKIESMYSTLAESFPELGQDTEGRFLFSVILAATSNGQAVLDNLTDAIRIYTDMRGTNKLPTNPKTSRSERNHAVVKTFREINLLVEEKGWEQAKKELLEPITVAELKKRYGMDVTGELADHTVIGAMIMGPKIGSFWGNLNGHYDSITMDLWFTRTMNRLSGDTSTINPEKLAAEFDALSKLPGLPADVKREIGIFKSALKKNEAWTRVPSDIREEVEFLYNFAKKTYSNYASSGFKDRSDLNKVTQKIIKELDGGEDTPDNGTHRKWMRTVVQEAQSQLQKAGINITNADLQAILWFHEKDLYTRFGATSTRGERTDYASAAAPALSRAAREETGTPILGSTSDAGRSSGTAAGRVGGEQLTLFQRPERVAPDPAGTIPKFRNKIIRLTHWSRDASLKQTDPSKHGTAGAGEELKRKRAYPDIYVNRTYVGFGSYRKEDQVGPHRYSIEVDGNSMYDYKKDPLDLYPSDQDLREAGHAPFDQQAAYTLYEKRIKEAGFAGYVHTAFSAGVLFDKATVVPEKSSDKTVPFDSGKESPSARLMQEEQAPKGSYLPAARNAGKAVLDVATGKADASTGAHEAAHAIYEFLLESGQITPENAAAFEAWLTDNGKKTTYVDKQEKFARGWERFILDGVSTGIEVVDKVFAQIAKFMSGIYTSIAGSSIDIEIPDNVREVFNKIASRGYELEKAGVAPTPAPIQIVGKAPKKKKPIPARKIAVSPTSIKNAATDRILEENGMAPIMGPARKANQESWDESMRVIADDPRAGEKIVAKIIKDDRSVRDEVEEGVLLHETAVRKADVARARARLAKNPKDPDLIADLKTAQSALYEVVLADKLAGTAWGRIGQFRQRSIKEDFTLEAMEARFRADINDGKPLSNADSRHVAELHKRITEAEEKARKLEAEAGVAAQREAALIKKLEEKRAAVRMPRDREVFVSRVKEKADAARAMLGRFQRLAQRMEKKNRDADYLAAVERGDMETAQRMVDEAAKISMDKPILAYHGTTSPKPFTEFKLSERPTPFVWIDPEGMIERDGFASPQSQYMMVMIQPKGDKYEVKSVGKNQASNKVFGTLTEAIDAVEKGRPDKKLSDRPAFFFATNRLYAENFSASSGNGVTARDSGQSRVMTVYVGRKKIFDFRDKGTREWLQNWISKNRDYIERETSSWDFDFSKNASLNNLKNGNWGIFEALPKLTEDLKSEGYTGYTTLEGGSLFWKGQSYEDWLKRGEKFRGRGGLDSSLNYAIFNPTDIKSADPVTYDEQGNVIPLSQRFNPETPSILYQSPEDQLTPDELEAFAAVGAEYLANGIRTLDQFEIKLKEEFPGAEAFAEQIFNAAQGSFKSTATAPRGAKTPVELKNLLDKENPNIDSKLIYNMARGFINQGLEGRDVLDAVTELLNEDFPDLTRDEVSDAFTGYGKVKYPSKEEDLVKLRELRNIERIQRQIDDVRAGLTPKKTGQQRDAASLKIRELQKELKDAMRAAGIKHTVNKNQLRGALDAIKSRYQNEIEELENAIRTKTKRKERRATVEYDEEIKALKVKRDKLKEDYDKTFGVSRKAMSEQQRVKAAIGSLSARIAEEEGMLKAGILRRVKAGSKTPLTPEIIALRNKLDAMREARSRAYDALHPKRTPEERALTRALAAAQKSIDRYNTILSGKPVAGKAPSVLTPNAALNALWSQRNALRKAVEQLRKVTRPRLSADEKARRQAVAQLDKSIKEIERRIATNDFGVKPKSAGRAAGFPDVVALRAQRDSLRASFEALKKASLPGLSPEEKKDLALIRASETRRKKIEARIAAGDYVKVERVPRVMSDKLAAARLAEGKAKEEWNRGFFEAELAKRSLGRKAYDSTVEVLNFSRTMKTIADVSAVLRQGLVTAVSHPFLSLAAVPDMFRAGFSQVQMQRIQDQIENHPRYALSQQAKLFLSDTGPDTTVAKIEEAFRGRWAKKVPGLRKVVNFSERTYNAYLNSVRMAHFNSLVEAVGGNPTVKEARILADFVNKATGRGDLRSMESAAAGLAAVFFSPKFVVSRFQLIWGTVPVVFDVATGFRLRSADVRKARKAIAVEYARFVLGASVIYALAALAKAGYGDDDDELVETDPRSSNFGKIKLGNTYIDPMGGLLQAAVFSTRMIKGETKTQKGEIQDLHAASFGKQSYIGVLGSFLRSKLSPIPSSYLNIRQGSDVVGSPSTVESEFIGSVIPLAFGDVHEVMRENGVAKGTPLAALALLGLGVQTRNEELSIEQYLATLVGSDPVKYSRKPRAGSVGGMKLKLDLKLDLKP